MTRTLAIFSAALVAACSSSSSSSSGGTGDGGSSGGGGSTGPRVTLTANLAPGTHGADCKQAMAGLTVGTFPDGPVAHQEMFNGGTALVQCRVAPMGTAFTVAGSVSLSGSGNGSFTLGGTFDASGAMKANTQVVFGAGGSYAGMGCTATYGSALEGVAAGRVWTDFTCASAVDNAMGSTCTLTGQVRFENCIQQ